MSLINDALTRAKQVPPAQPPQLPLRPVEGRQKSSNRTGWIIGIVAGSIMLILAVALVSVLAFAWNLSEGSRNSNTSVSQSHPTVPSEPSVSVSTPQPPPVAQAPSQRAVPERTEVVVTPAHILPTAPVLTLQAILFSPARPSVAVNGRTLFIGDTIGDYTVTSITRGSCTLVSQTDTRILELKDQ